MGPQRTQDRRNRDQVRRLSRPAAQSIDKLRNAEARTIPAWFDYPAFSGLSREMEENSPASAPHARPGQPHPRRNPCRAFADPRLHRNPGQAAGDGRPSPQSAMTSDIADPERVTLPHPSGEAFWFREPFPTNGGRWIEAEEAMLIQQNTFEFTPATPGWTLHLPPGPPEPGYRIYNWSLIFDTPFPAGENDPIIIISILHVEANVISTAPPQKLRYLIGSIVPSLTGFTAQIQCWDATSLVVIAGTWTAFEQ